MGVAAINCEELRWELDLMSLPYRKISSKCCAAVRTHGPFAQTHWYAGRMYDCIINTCGAIDTHHPQPDPDKIEWISIPTAKEPADPYRVPTLHRSSP